MNAQQHEAIDLGEVLSKAPERIKKGILQCSAYNDPAQVQCVVNGLTETATIQNLEIIQCFIPATDKKFVPHFTLNTPMYIKPPEKRTMNERSKTDMLKLFVLLFAPSGVNKRDI